MTLIYVYLTAKTTSWQYRTISVVCMKFRIFSFADWSVTNIYEIKVQAIRHHFRLFVDSYRKSVCAFALCPILNFVQNFCLKILQNIDAVSG